jgi:hypothetical protein
MLAEIDWERGHAPPEYLVLTGARTWMFAATHRIASKLEAGEWAAARGQETGVVEAALARHRGATAEMAREAAERFADTVERLVLGILPDAPSSTGQS